MIVASSLGGSGHAPPRPVGTRLLASIDVEWQKNYRIRNGNRAFCYSVVWLVVPEHAAVLGKPSWLPFTYTSAYLDPDEDPTQLVELADADLEVMLDAADLIVGHQLCSDLAVLAANASSDPSRVRQAQEAWRDRRRQPVTERRFLDTRFDVDHILVGPSRRLVDVCTELDLDVTQPELSHKSMTALHRDWLATHDVEARERISVLNLRHSLSTAFVALRAAGQLNWTDPINVNQTLDDGLGGIFGWLDHPTFRGLL